MLATFSDENRVLQAMTRLGLTAQLLGELSALENIQGCSHSIISAALRGGRPLGREKAERLIQLLDELERIQKDKDLLSLGSNVHEIKLTLDQHRIADQGANGEL